MLLVDKVRRDTGMVPWYEETERAAARWTYIVAGYGKCLYWIGGHKTLFEQGDVLLLPPGTRYYGKSIPSVSHEKVVVTFSAAADISHASLPLLGAAAPLHLRTARWELLLARAQTMAEQWAEQLPYTGALCSALLLESLVYMNRERGQGPHSSVKHRHAELMKTYLKNHYRERVTKEDLGAVIEKSPNYAAALFSEMTGLTIAGFVHGLRVKTAIYLLQHSGLTVADIAEQLGYCDPSYFHKVFKRLTGVAPSHYLQHRESPLL